VLGAQRVLLGQGKAQLAAGGDPIARERRAGGEGQGAPPGPGGFDGPLDQAGRDDPGHPPADGEPGVGGGELECEVGLPAERAPPRRTEKRHEIGPQGGRPLRVDFGRGEHLHQACPLGEATRLAAPDGGDRDGGGEGDSGERRSRCHAEMPGQRAEVVEQPGRLGARVGKVAGERPRQGWELAAGQGSVAGWTRSRGWPPFGRWLEVGGVIEGLLDAGPAQPRPRPGWRGR